MRGIAHLQNEMACRAVSHKQALPNFQAIFSKNTICLPDDLV